MKVAATYFDWEDELYSLQKDLAGFDPEHLIAQINLREVEKIPELIENVVDRFGRLDGGYVLGGEKVGEMPKGVL